MGEPLCCQKRKNLRTLAPSLKNRSRIQEVRCVKSANTSFSCGNDTLLALTSEASVTPQRITVMSFIGKPKGSNNEELEYRSTDYLFPDGFKSRHNLFGVALLDWVRQTQTRFSLQKLLSRLVILGTNTSFWKMWADFAGCPELNSSLRSNDIHIRSAARVELQNAIRNKLKIDTECIEIPPCYSSSEISKTLHTLIGCFEEREGIYLDLAHGTSQLRQVLWQAARTATLVGDGEIIDAFFTSHTTAAQETTTCVESLKTLLLDTELGEAFATFRHTADLRALARMVQHRTDISKTLRQELSRLAFNISMRNHHKAVICARNVCQELDQNPHASNPFTWHLDRIVRPIFEEGALHAELALAVHHFRCGDYDSAFVGFCEACRQALEEMCVQRRRHISNQSQKSSRDEEISTLTDEFGIRTQWHQLRNARNILAHGYEIVTTRKSEYSKNSLRKIRDTLQKEQTCREFYLVLYKSICSAIFPNAPAIEGD
jgi:hypothetical protein